MAKYSTYSIEELAADNYFCRWVLYPDADTRAFWEDLQNSDPEMGKKILQARQLVLAVRVKESEVPDEKIAELWSNLQSQIDEAESGAAKIRQLGSVSWYIGIAASIILLVGVIFLILRPRQITHMVAKGERQHIILPDSSEVILNADSKLAYDEKKWADNRVVLLSGEGFFEVKKGSTFRVETSGGNVEVLGTSFNVLAREDHFEVACFTGKVAVSGTKDQANKSILTPGKSVAIAETGTMDMPEEFEIESHKDWRVGTFKYEKEEVTFVLDEIARQFNKEIIFEGSMENRTFSGEFTNKNLDSTLTKVCWLLKLDYELEGNTITLKSK